MISFKAIALQINHMIEQQNRSMKFPADKQIILLENIHQLIISDAYIAKIAIHTTTYGSPLEKKIGQSITKALHNKGSFALGLKPYIDPMAFQAIAAGEKSGQVAQGLLNAIEAIKMRKSMAIKLVWTLLKPLGFIAIAFAAAAAVAYWVFPILAKNLPKESWKAWPTLVYEFGSFWATYGLIIGAVVLCLLVFSFVTIPFLTGPIRAALDSLPFYRQYRMVVIVNSLRSLGYMVRAGHDLSEAMDSLIDHSTQYLISHLEIMRDHLGSDSNLGDIMDTGLLTREWVGLLQMVSESGHFDVTLLRGADVVKKKLDQEIEKLSTWGAAAIKVVGIAIFFFVIGGTLMLMVDLIKIRPF